MADTKNKQTKSFRVTSKVSNKFLGFFNVADSLSTEDYKLVEEKFLASWEANNINISESIISDVEMSIL
jgi:hypothetical protein